MAAMFILVYREVGYFVPHFMHKGVFKGVYNVQ